MEINIVDPDVLNFGGEPIKIITKENKKFLGQHHKIAQVECEIDGRSKTYSLYGQKNLGLFIKDFHGEIK